MTESSSLEEMKNDVEGTKVRGIMESNDEAYVDEIGTCPDGIAVYVRGAVQYDSPPRKLNKKMLEHGYSFIDWAVNGNTGDSRALFVYQDG